MMNPKVGLTVFTSSFISCLTIVVLPALSNPLKVVIGFRCLIALSKFLLTASESSSPCPSVVLSVKLIALFTEFLVTGVKANKKGMICPSSLRQLGGLGWSLFLCDAPYLSAVKLVKFPKSQCCAINHQLCILIHVNHPVLFHA